MALPARQQLTYWGVAALVFCVALWGLGSVLLPFLVGGAIAYFLDPVVDRLQRLGISRLIATSLIALAVTLGVVICGLLIVPTLIRQLSGLIEAAPDIASRLQSFLTDQFPQLTEPGSVVNETLKSLGEAVKNRGGEVAQTILTSAMGVVNFAVFIVVVPVVAFYMLMDWDKIVERVDSWLPRDHIENLRAIFRDIDSVLSGFVRGQMSVCIILGAFYAIALMLAGLNFGLIAGSIAGMLTFIPYVGAIIGGGLSIGLALYQFWGDWLSIGIVVGIFMFGQFMEGNIITPRFVGNSIGLHPLWLIFALSAFGTLFGFVGMLIAVPVAAVIGVLTRFALDRYLHGELYLGSQRYRNAPRETPPDAP